MNGLSAADFTAIARSLHGNSLPPGWKWVGSSTEASVATDGRYYAKLFLPRDIWAWPKQPVRVAERVQGKRRDDLVRPRPDGNRTAALLCST